MHAGMGVGIGVLGELQGFCVEGCRADGMIMIVVMAMRTMRTMMAVTAMRTVTAMMAMIMRAAVLPGAPDHPKRNRQNNEAGGDLQIGLG